MSRKMTKTEKSNDSPKIPDRRVTSDIPGLPSGDTGEKRGEKHKYINHYISITFVLE